MQDAGLTSITKAQAITAGMSAVDAAALWRIVDSNYDNNISQSELSAYSQVLTNGINNTASLSTMYGVLNVSGLEAAHNQGWTGKGVDIAVYDSGLHGIEVSATAAAVAPGSAVEFNTQSGIFITGTPLVNGSAEVTNHSYGSTTTGYYITRDRVNSYVNKMNRADLLNSSALHVWAGPNTNDCAQSLNSQTANPVNPSTDALASECDAATVAFLEGNVNGEHIFVGAVDNCANKDMLSIYVTFEKRHCRCVTFTR